MTHGNPFSPIDLFRSKVSSLFNLNIINDFRSLDLNGTGASKRGLIYRAVRTFKLAERRDPIWDSGGRRGRDSASFFAPVHFEMTAAPGFIAII